MRLHSVGDESLSHVGTGEGQNGWGCVREIKLASAIIHIKGTEGWHSPNEVGKKGE